ncbi:hypothetical protein KIN20_000777 [Parelaphostrongylus tenuis]|uniref:Uncharacterized protein n=1 Tax=Parelaphostrongylus tenuis TaxID=148309 RepID=A0AAD5QFU5_PARTN|nr:hypothetical protein KIN20_000777 [Parelaphostrongylus tenuis]
MKIKNQWQSRQQFVYQPQRDREFLSERSKTGHNGLTMVYVNGKYVGERLDCSTCSGIGYTVCRFCGGGKKLQETFRVRLRCTRCDRNGIAHCPSCSSSLSPYDHNTLCNVVEPVV